MTTIASLLPEPLAIFAHSLLQDKCYSQLLEQHNFTGVLRFVC